MRTKKILNGQTVLAHDDGRSMENGEAFAKTYWMRADAERDAAELGASVAAFSSNNRTYYHIVIA